MKHKQEQHRQKHRARRPAGLLLALVLAVSLVGTTGLPALAATEAAAQSEAAAASDAAAVSETADDSGTVLAAAETVVSEESDEDEEVTLSGGETITAGGTYRLASDASGVITISTTDDVEIIGNGAEYDEDTLEMTSTPNEGLFFDAGDTAGIRLTLRDVFISDTSADVPLLDLTGDDNILTIEGTNVLDMDTGYNLNANIHVGLGTSLTINGSGTLYLYKNTQGAGIGGNNEEMNGEIIFGDDSSELTVFAKGTKQGALIGAGANAGSTGESPGSISFVEGMYNLISNSRGAAVGGSAGSGGASSGTTVFVGTKANININVDYSGAAVGGGGYDGGNDSSGGYLYVLGGSLRCYIDRNAAGNTTGWMGNGYTAGVNDAAITAQRLNGDGEAVYKVAFDTTALEEEADTFEVYADGELFYVGSLPEYGFIQELLDKGEQKTITSTVSNWYPNGETNLYFYLTGEDHTLTVNGEEFQVVWDEDSKTLTADVGAASVESNEETTWYETIEEALSYAGSLDAEATVTLLGDCTVEDTLSVPAGADITLDLSGHSLCLEGSGSVLEAGGSLTVTDSSEDGDGTITGGTGESDGDHTFGGGIRILSGGSFTMTGGSVTGCTANYGGGVYVAAGGSFTMTGGSITGCTADYGGGVYVEAGGSFTMAGGNITGNTADTAGGGVYLSDPSAAAVLSGTPVLTGNAVSDATDNLRLASGAYITLDGEMASGASVGVTAEETPSEGSAVRITEEEDGTSYYKSAAKYISSDAGYYVVQDRVNGYLELSVEVQEAWPVAIVESGDASAYFYDVGEAFTYIAEFGGTWTVTLLDTCETNETLEVPEGVDVTLDLAGYTLSAADGVSISILTVNGSLTLADSSADVTGKVTGGSGTEGTNYDSISSSERTGLGLWGGGVYVGSGGALTVSGGSISGNTLSGEGYDSGFGGGVYVSDGGSLTVTGGSISGNTVSLQSGFGGGVFVSDGGSFTMTGGSISGNTLAGVTCGSYVYGYGYGGGVYVGSDCTFLMTGGEVSGNIMEVSGAFGGGIYSSSTFAMEGGDVSGNTISSDDLIQASGGGICCSGLILSGGSISGNTINGSTGVNYASGGGAGLYVNGSVDISGGSITGNTVTLAAAISATISGGGVVSSGSVSVSGTPVISGNSANGTEYNLKANKRVVNLDEVSVTLGELEEGACIGVTTDTVPSSGSPVRITQTETDTAYYLEAARYFFSDGGYYVAANSDGYLEMLMEPYYYVITSLTYMSNSSLKAAVGEDYTTTLTADTGYALPESVTVTVSGTELAAGVEYIYDAASGDLTIYAESVTGPIRISGEGIRVSWGVSTSLENLSLDGAERAAVGEDYTAVLAADTNYVLPESVAVTVGGEELYAGEGYIYDPESGELTIYASYVDGDIVISAEGILSSLAQDSDGYYMISTEEELGCFAEMVENGYAGSSARLTADITVTADSGFAGIGTSDVPFTGIFDGDGHTVTLSLSTDSAAGLFAFVSGAVVRDVTVAGTVETSVATYGAAGLVSYVMADGVTIENCVNKADISGAGYVGGLIGRTSGSTSSPVEVTVIESSNEGSVTSTGNYAGGIVPVLYSGSITGCVNSGTVSGTGYTGGIIGYAYSADGLEILKCGNEGSVTGSSSYTGGIAGYARKASSASLEMGSLYNAAAVSGTSYVGGIAGRSYAGISNAYNVGAVNGTAVSTGGLIGANFGSGAVLSNAYSAGEVAYTSSDVACAGGLLIGSISSASYVMYVDNVYYLGTLDGSVIASGSSYLYSSSTQAALTDEEFAAMAKASGELAALADTLGESFAGNSDSDYHLGYPVLTWETDAGEGGDGEEGDGEEGDGDEGDDGGEEEVLNGLYADEDGMLAYYVDGVIDTTYTGVATTEDGTVYYVESGYVGSYTGLAKDTSDGTWYYFTDSVLDADYTGLVKNAANGILYYVADGTIGWDYTGMAKYAAEGAWYYVTGGTIDWTYTGLAKNAANGIWYYFADGRLDWTYTGLVKHSNGIYYYVTDAQLNWGYTGWVEYNGSSYYISNGQLDWEKTAEG